MIPTEIELSEREREILRLVATGASNKQIALDLVISTNTVKVHLRNIFAKIGVTSRTEATLYAIREGLVPAPGIPLAPKQVIDESITPELPITKDSRRPARGMMALVALFGLVALSLIGYIFRTGSLQKQPTPSPFTSQWQVKASLPTARSGLASAAFEEQIYAFGGEGKSGVLGEVDRYSPGTNKWAVLSSMPTAVTDIGAVVVSGKIFIPGGRLASGQCTDILQVFDPLLNTWTQGARIPITVSAYAIAALDGKIYLFGGWDGSKALASVYLYDPETDRWTNKTDMPTARKYAGAAAINGKLFVVGGSDGAKGLTTNEVYTPERDIQNDHPWDERAPLPAPRYAMGMISQADIGYLLGGVTPDKSHNIPLVYLYRINEWQEFQAPPNLSGSALTMVAMDGDIYAIGGNVASNPSAVSQAYRAIYTISFPIIR